MVSTLLPGVPTASDGTCQSSDGTLTFPFYEACRNHSIRECLQGGTIDQLIWALISISGKRKGLELCPSPFRFVDSNESTNH